MEFFERGRVGAEVLRPLEVQDGGEHALSQAGFYLPRGAHHPEAPPGARFEPEELLRQRPGHLAGAMGVEG